MGKHSFFLLLAPTAIISMALPFWYLILPKLQQLTITVTSLVLHKIQIPAFIEGFMITLPNGIIHVAQGCSGFKYFLTAGALSFILVAFKPRKNKYNVMIIVSLTILAIASNWLRVIILVLIGYYEGLDHPLLSNHDSLGWAIFILITILPMLYLDRQLPQRKHQLTAHSYPSFLKPKQLMLTCTTLILAWLYSWWLQLPKPHNRLEIAMPEVFSQWETTASRYNWKPNYFGYTSHKTNTYALNENFVDVNILEYLNNSAENELISSNNSIFDSDTWPTQKQYYEETADINIVNSGLKNGNRYLVTYWYETTDLSSTSRLMTKAILIYHTIVGKSEVSYLVTLSTRCMTDCASEAEYLIPIAKQWRTKKPHIDRG